MSGSLWNLFPFYYNSQSGEKRKKSINTWTITSLRAGTMFCFVFYFCTNQNHVLYNPWQIPNTNWVTKWTGISLATCKVTLRGTAQHPAYLSAIASEPQCSAVALLRPDYRNLGACCSVYDLTLELLQVESVVHMYSQL